jgi:ATP-dependent metalloprotease
VQGVIIIGATNFPQSLDEALLRPGRFDKHVNVPLPDIKGRRQILEMYLQKVPADADVDLDLLARGTPGEGGRHGVGWDH